MMKRIRRAFALIVMLICPLLAACGGTSGQSAATAPAAPASLPAGAATPASGNTGAAQYPTEPINIMAAPRRAARKASGVWG
jgi:hypothetical protein